MRSKALKETPSHIKLKLKSLTDEPGIYKMLDKAGRVIYIGKAKHLNKRVSSYFQKTHDRFKTTVLVFHIADFETIVTRSEKEALVLERQLIREFLPRYNVALKDDKSYPYIRVTLQDPFPRVTVVHQKEKADKATYFGPFPSIGSTKRLQRFVYELFPLRDCSKPIDLVTKQRKCIQLDIGNCIGPCIYKEVKAEYDALVEELILFLQGKNEDLIRRFTDDMKRFSREQKYEKAAVYRDRIRRIERLNVQQLVDSERGHTFMIVAGAIEGATVYIVIQRYIEGKLLYQHGFYHKSETDDAGFQMDEIKTFVERCSYEIAEFLEEDSSKELLTMNELLPEMEDLVSGLGVATKVFVPQRGKRREFLELALKNALVSCKRIIRETKLTLLEKPQLLLENLQQKLQLRHLPRVVLGFDISHLQGTNIVASAVCFKDGKPFKAGYRRYSIRSYDGTSHDPGSLYEAVLRRLKQSKDEGELMPNLLLIDGGKAQLHFAYKALVSVFDASEIDILSIAKREELLFAIGKDVPYRLSHASPELQFFQRVRDESHRFALTYQRKKRRSQIQSVLESIPGVGPKRVDKLYSVYGSLAVVKEQSVENLMHDCGLPLRLAAVILATISHETT